MARKRKVEEVEAVEAEVEEAVAEVESDRPFVVVDSHTVARRGVEDPQAERR